MVLQMLIREQASQPDLSKRKEVKVRIPIRMHVRLHSLKILTGREIGEVVTEALEIYFHERSEAEEAEMG